MDCKAQKKKICCGFVGKNRWRKYIMTKHRYILGEEKTTTLMFNYSVNVTSKSLWGDYRKRVGKLLIKC